MPTSFLNETNPSKSSVAKREVIRQCIEKDKVSISDLSKELRISIPTVTKLVSELIAEGFILDLGKVGTSGGRRPNIYGLNPEAGYFLGIDIARQHFHIAVSNFKGELIHYIQDIEFVLENKPESFNSMCLKIKDEVTKAKIPWIKVLGACVSLSGRVNPEKGFSLSYFAKGELPLKDIFQTELKIPVIIENDSRAMCYGEYMTLGDVAEDDMLLINVSWGLGMGMMMGGKLYYGKSGFSGEIGHFPLLDNDMLCRCGKVGCLETEASGQALHRMIVDEIRRGRKSSLAGILENNGDLKLHEILNAIEEGDVLAIECLEKIGDTIGRAIAGLINIFNPGLLVIGGRLIVGGNYLLFPIRTAINRHSLNRVSEDSRIIMSTLGRKAAAIGDCLLSRAHILGLM